MSAAASASSTTLLTVPIGRYTGSFEARLLHAIKDAKTVTFQVEKSMRQERDFETLAKFSSDLVIGKNGPGFAFTLILDRRPYYKSPPVWGSEEEVQEAVPKFLDYVRTMPLMHQKQKTD